MSHVVPRGAWVFLEDLIADKRPADKERLLGDNGAFAHAKIALQAFCDRISDGSLDSKKKIELLGNFMQAYGQMAKALLAIEDIATPPEGLRQPVKDYAVSIVAVKNAADGLKGSYRADKFKEDSDSLYKILKREADLFKTIIQNLKIDDPALVAQLNSISASKKSR